MTIKIHNDLEQGSVEWLQARCGLLTASEMKLIVTPTLKPASNDKSRAHVFELLAQRVTGYVEPSYVSDDMLRGIEQEDDALEIYNEEFAEITRTGFITNDRWGFTIGYSPDAMVGDDGLVEVKCPRQKSHIKIVVTGIVPDEYMMQLQTGLLVTGRKWIDFVSYHAGLPMVTIRVKPDAAIQQAILGAVCEFEAQIKDLMDTYNKNIKSKKLKLIPTERIIEEEITI